MTRAPIDPSSLDPVTRPLGVEREAAFGRADLDDSLSARHPLTLTLRGFAAPAGMTKS